MRDAPRPTTPEREFWAPSDPIGEVLHLMRMESVFYALSQLTAPWGMDMPPIAESMMFHVVTEGRCWIEVQGLAPRCLEPGTLALVPHGQGHRLVSEVGEASEDLFAIPREELGRRYERIRYGGGGVPTQLVCGAVHFDHPAGRLLLDRLPRLICVDARTAEQVEWLQSTLRFMATEAKELRPGGETVITRLADVLVVQALRYWMNEGSAAKTGWLRALRDPQIGQAILLVHREPGAPWSVESLASAVGMSRSALAARFRALAGESVMQYVTRWRMLVAAELLREGAPPLIEVANRLGYRSEAAFSRAFKRVVGVPPGKMRGERARRS